MPEDKPPFKLIVWRDNYTEYRGTFEPTDHGGYYFLVRLERRTGSAPLWDAWQPYTGSGAQRFIRDRIALEPANPSFPDGWGDHLRKALHRHVNREVTNAPATSR